MIIHTYKFRAIKRHIKSKIDMLHFQLMVFQEEETLKHFGIVL